MKIAVLYDRWEDTEEYPGENADIASGERARLLKRLSDPPLAPVLQAAE